MAHEEGSMEEKVHTKSMIVHASSQLLVALSPWVIDFPHASHVSVVSLSHKKTWAWAPKSTIHRMDYWKEGRCQVVLKNTIHGAWLAFLGVTLSTFYCHHDEHVASTHPLAHCCSPPINTQYRFIPLLNLEAIMSHWSQWQRPNGIWSHLPLGEWVKLPLQHSAVPWFEGSSNAPWFKRYASKCFLELRASPTLAKEKGGRWGQSASLGH